MKLTFIFILLLAGCIHEVNHKSTFELIIDESRLVSRNEFMNVINEILDKPSELPFRCITSYNGTNTVDYWVDRLGRVLDSNDDILYKSRIKDRNKSFDEVPIIYPLIDYLHIDGGLATLIHCDQLGREVKVQAL